MQLEGDSFQNTAAAFFRAWNFFLLLPEFLWDVVGNQAEHKAAIARLFDLERKTIQKRKDELAVMTQEERAQAKDLIPVLLREGAKFSNDPEQKDEVISDENVRELVHEAILGSLDTSWNTLCMFIWHMARNEDIQEKLRVDILNFLKEHPRPSYADVNNTLPNLESALLETFRFRPTSHMVFKAVSKETTLGGYPLEKGHTVFFHTEGITTNPKHFPLPDKYDPERFTQGNADPKIVFQFGHGRRLCPGQSLGSLQLRMFVIRFLSRFKIKAAPGNPDQILGRYEVVRAVKPECTKVFVELV